MPHRAVALAPEALRGGWGPREASLKPRRPLRTSLGEAVLVDDIGFHIAQAEVSTTRIYQKHIGEPLSLRPVEYSLLMLLLTKQELSPKQLSQALALPAPSLTMVVDRLHERGMLDRVRSETDRRSQRVLLTDQGKALAQQAAGKSPAMRSAFDALLSPGEKLFLLELLTRIVDHDRSSD
jgi:DNA-binding MarR family transcriptional regulator